MFRLARDADRRAVLENAYDVGFRHFDVAPMYGLGEMEPFFGSVMARHRDTITITTKFGIDVTGLGRLAARLQTPVRAALARQARLNQRLEISGDGPKGGRVGRLLYSQPAFSPREAEKTLTHSLQALRTDYVDVLLLHDYGGLAAADALIEFLNSQRESGRIRYWGLAIGAGYFENETNLSPFSNTGLDDAEVLQVRSDLCDPFMSFPRGTITITYGVLGRILPLLQRFFASLPDQRREWGARLATDLDDPRSLPTLLLRDALQRNPGGPVLFSSNRIERIGWAASFGAQVSEDTTGRQGQELRALAKKAMDTLHHTDRAS